MNTRAVPFHCPYCGDEQLRPHEVLDAAEGEPTSPHGTWECRSCLRAFRLSLIGRLRRPESASPGGAR